MMAKTVQSKNIQVNITTRSILVTAGIILLVLGLLKVIDFIMVILVAVVLSAFIEGIANSLIKRKVPRSIAVTSVFILLFGSFITVAYFFIPIFLSEISQFASYLPEGSQLRSIVQIFGDFANAKDALALLGSEAKGAFTGLESLFSNFSGSLLQSFSTAFGGLINVILILVISLYLSLQGKGIERFLRAVTPIEHEEYIISIWSRTERKIGLWFRGQLLVALILGFLTYVGLIIFNIPYALMLSLTAAIFGLIPFGIFIATIPAIIIGFTNGGLELALVVLAIYVGVQQLEEYIFRPLILNKVTGVPSLIILLSLVVGAKLGGFLGLFLGLPTAIMAVELVNDYEERKAKQLKLKRKTTI